MKSIQFEAFIKVLESKGYSYRVENQTIIIDENKGVDLRSLKSLPEFVQFNNGENVYLSSLKTLPKSTQFNNGGSVDLESLKSLSKSTQFNNGGNVYLELLTEIPEGVQFNNGGNVYLQSLKSLSESTPFNNGGYVYFSSGMNPINTPYLTRFNISVESNKVILYKRVSSDFKTQEGESWETVWSVGSNLVHPAWNPSNRECGEGMFHACAKPWWCDAFRSTKGDKYIGIEIAVADLYEWTRNSAYPSKIAFRECIVLYECDRKGNKI
jgi:hypothetical protein